MVSGFETAVSFQIQASRLIPRGALDQLFRRQVRDLQEPFHAVVIKKRAPRDTSRGQRGAAVFDNDGKSSERIIAVRHSRGTHRIGNHHDLFTSLHGKNQLDHLVAEMHAVGNDLNENVLCEESSADKPELQVVERRQHIAEMRQVLHSRHAHFLEHFISRKRMGAGWHDAAFRQFARECRAARKLRRKRDLFHRADRVPFIDQRDVGIPQKCRILRSRSVRREKRPFQMHPEKTCAGPVFCPVFLRGPAGLCDVFQADAQGCGEKSRDAVGQFAFSDGFERSHVAVGKIRAAASVAVDVQVARCNNFPVHLKNVFRMRDFRAGRDDPFDASAVQQQGRAFQIDVGRDQAAVLQERRHFLTSV